MRLVKYITQTKTKLLVNSLDTEDRVDELLNELKDGVKYEITLLNIKTIPSKVIIRLQELNEHIKLIINDSKLRYYLRDLNFNLSYKQHKNLFNKHLENIECIGLGGSAGSLEKFRKIIQALPKSNLTIFIVMHQKSDTDSALAEILQRCTEHYRVVEANTDQVIMPATIYVAPPSKHMLVAGGYIFLTDDEPKHYSKPSITTTFMSLSSEYKDRFLSIIVCGYGSDGSDSLKTIRNNGGCVIIEQPFECEATAMLENAINSKEYDYILSIDNINSLLYDKLCPNNNIEEHIDDFLLAIYNKYGYDYRNYNKEHIKRRVEHFYVLVNAKNFTDFKQLILQDKDIFKNMFLNISINVTTFFRNPQTYKKLKEKILPAFKNKSSIKIWCAGASSGEEPYSIAILLKELGLLEKSLIYATDINEIILSQAKNGIYSHENYQRFLENYQEASDEVEFYEYFDFFDNFVIIKEELKEKILFFKHNLVSDGVLNEFQLIFCRNVIIYFNNELKLKVFNLFDDSLQDDGVLVLGESEVYDNRENFTTIDNINKFYKKKFTK